MASEYLKKKAKEQEIPKEEPPVYTKADKAKNWLYYHWYWLLAGAVVLWIAGSMLWNILGIGQIRPDHVFAYVGKKPLLEEQAEALETALAALGTDGNGDGKVKIEVRQYATGRTGDLEPSLFYNQAADTQLLADITRGESYFFLTDDPASLQRGYQILAERDGSAPAEWDYTPDGKAFLWSECPVLRDLPVEQDVFSTLWIGRRYYTDDQKESHAADEALWEILVKGVNN